MTVLLYFYDIHISTRTPSLTEPVGNALQAVPTVKMMGTADSTTVRDSSVAFPPEPVKDKHHEGVAGSCLWFGIWEQPRLSIQDNGYDAYSLRRCSSRKRRSSFARSRFLARYSLEGCGRLHSGITISEHFR